MPRRGGCGAARPVRWQPGLTNSCGEKVMPCGLTASELEALVSDDLFDAEGTEEPPWRVPPAVVLRGTKPPQPLQALQPRPPTQPQHTQQPAPHSLLEQGAVAAQLTQEGGGVPGGLTPTAQEPATPANCDRPHLRPNSSSSARTKFTPVGGSCDRLAGGAFAEPPSIAAATAATAGSTAAATVTTAGSIEASRPHTAGSTSSCSTEAGSTEAGPLPTPDGAAGNALPLASHGGPAAAGAGGEGSSACRRSENALSRFESVNRVAAVAGNEYVVRRSGEKERRSREQQRRRRSSEASGHPGPVFATSSLFAPSAQQASRLSRQQLELHTQSVRRQPGGGPCPLPPLAGGTSAAASAPSPLAAAEAALSTGWPGSSSNIAAWVAASAAAALQEAPLAVPRPSLHDSAGSPAACQLPHVPGGLAEHPAHMPQAASASQRQPGSSGASKAKAECRSLCASLNPIPALARLLRF